MKRIKTNDDDFRTAVLGSKTYAEILTKLGLVPRGGNYKTVKRRIKTLGLSVAHLVGRSCNKGRKGKPNSFKKPLDLIMVEDSSYSTSMLKERLFKEGLFKRECNRCGGTSWLGKPMPLELEHKNGNSSDHRIENIEILCPNCHSFTDTYRGRNKKSTETIQRKCLNCGERVSASSKSGMCSVCAPKFSRKAIHCECGKILSHFRKTGLCSSCLHRASRRVERPSIDVLMMDVKGMGYLATGRKYGVSDNTIRKWIKNENNVLVAQLAGGATLKM